MAVSNIINIEFGNMTMVETEPHYQYDYGQKVKFTDLSLPSKYEVHFSNDATQGYSYSQMGDSNGVSIPDALFQTGKPIFVFLYLHSSDNDGRTVYVAKIPVRPRAKPSDYVPTPEEQSALTRAIAAIQEAAETISVSQEKVEQLVSEKVEEIFDDPDIGERIGALSIGDGTLGREKVDANFEAHGKKVRLKLSLLLRGHGKAFTILMDMASEE